MLLPSAFQGNFSVIPTTSLTLLDQLFSLIRLIINLTEIYVALKNTEVRGAIADLRYWQALEQARAQQTVVVVAEEMRLLSLLLA